MPITLDREKVKNKLKRALKNFDDESIEEIVEVVYDDIFKTLEEKTNQKFETSEAKVEFEALRGDIKVLAETMKMGFEMFNKRFEAVDKRFEDMNKRFEDMNKRFEDMNKKINILIWVVSLWLTVFSAISLILRIFG